AGGRLDLSNLSIPEAPEFKEALAGPFGIFGAGRIALVSAARQIHAAAEFFEQLLAGFAVAHPAALPAVGEDAIDLVERHDLTMDIGHEFKVVRAVGASHPAIRVGPMLA